MTLVQADLNAKAVLVQNHSVMQKKLENLSWKIERNEEGFKSQLKSKKHLRTLWVRTLFPLVPNTLFLTSL